MSLFSDVDWTIILVIGGFLFLGGGKSMEVFRTLGRLYGKVQRIRQELMAEFHQQMVEPSQRISAGNTPLPVVQAPGPSGAKPSAPALPPPGTPAVAAPAPSALAAPQGGEIREVHTGSPFPSEGAEMYR